MQKKKKKKKKKKNRVYGVYKKMVHMANPDLVRAYQKAQISYLAI